jgi:hypothetical protein
LYAENLALKDLMEQAGIDWKEKILPSLMTTKQKAGDCFAPLYMAGADLDLLHEALQHFLGIKH